MKNCANKKLNQSAAGKSHNPCKNHFLYYAPVYRRYSLGSTYAHDGGSLVWVVLTGRPKTEAKSKQKTPARSAEKPW